MRNSNSLTDKTISGFIWLLGSSGAQAILRVIFVAILARLLTPEDFGLIATAMLVISFTELVAQIGVGPALVQKKDITDKHITTAFSFIIFLGIGLYLFFLLINPLLASFFNMPELEKVLNLLCVILPFHMFSQVSYSMMQKKLLFKKLAGWDTFSYGVGYGAVGISLAYLGIGVFSLVWASITQAILYSTILFIINPHSLRLGFYKNELKELIISGSGFSLASIFNYFALNGDYLIIGKFLGAAQLGIYSRAYTLMNMVNKIFGNVIHKILFSTFSIIQTDNEKLTQGLERSLNLIAITLIPLTVFCYLFANEIIVLLLGEKWLNVVSPYKILIFGMFFRVAYKITTTFLMGTGLIMQNTFFQLIYMILIIFGSYSFIKFGINAIAYVVIFTLMINFIIQFYFLWKKGMVKIKFLFLPILKTIPLLTIILILSYSIILINRIIMFNDIFVMLLSAFIIFILSLIFLYFELEQIVTKDGVWLFKKLKTKLDFK